jgi:hypothetical protein
MYVGRRTLPESWIAEATARQVPNGENTMPDWLRGRARRAQE